MLGCEKWTNAKYFMHFFIEILMEKSSQNADGRANCACADLAGILRSEGAHLQNSRACGD